MNNCYINIGAVKAKEIDGELYISCWNFSKAISEKEKEISDLCKENDKLQKQISELESELAVKEDLLKISSGIKNIGEGIEFEKIHENYEEEPLPFYCDEYEDVLLEELEKLRDRHQQDCITINQLQTTIDTLVDRYAKLREMKGL